MNRVRSQVVEVEPGLLFLEVGLAILNPYFKILIMMFEKSHG